MSLSQSSQLEAFSNLELFYEHLEEQDISGLVNFQKIRKVARTRSHRGTSYE